MVKFFVFKITKGKARTIVVCQRLVETNCCLTKTVPRLATLPRTSYSVLVSPN